MHTNFSETTLLALGLLLLPACAPDASSDTADASDTSDAQLASCECSDIAAEDVSFDPSGTTLTSETTQAALVELSSAPVPDFADRITIVDNAVTRTVGTSLLVAASCGPQGDFLALGGGCVSASSNLVLVDTELTDGSMRCDWDKPNGQAATGTARVTCLSLVP